MAKPFASSADLGEKKRTLELLADGVYALTAEGDPNIGAIEGEDFVVCFEALATPVAAQEWIDLLREHTDKPITHLVLSHYHAVRVLGAAAYGAEHVIAHETTKKLIDERGQEDWDSEFGRMPRLFKEPESIPGLTHPTETFSGRHVIDLGGDRGNLVLEYCGRGHTAGDIVAWVEKPKVLFAGDLVEAEAALYTGDAFHWDWSGATLDRLKDYGAEFLIGGRGGVTRGREAVDGAIEQTREFIRVMIREVEAVHARGGTLKEAFDATHTALAPQFGHWPIFEHCLPFDVQRVWDELDGVDWPRVWTAERDREVWDQLQN
ncbi:MBL fold metallo-hydrolase [Mobilicoccus massiliensis]|uniref:MBL fold metallo-hydrolase n=1 Tax=Mobilicoccus massiliensis TaxID=1522310 RepID=UPI00058F567A|nr:MBL fold metallo-hydrolase [Mobilicoccus massiliensis]